MWSDKKEIGSEFWDAPTQETNSNYFPEKAQWYLSGRSALQAIIMEIDWAKTVSMPSWCCDSMVKPFIDAGMAVNFYPVYFKNGFVQDIKYDSDVLFVMDYFGYASEVEIIHPCKIRDMTHTIFSGTYNDSDYYFGSLRKWCGVWTGGYAWTKDEHQLVMNQVDNVDYIVVRQKAMDEKSRFIADTNDNLEKRKEDKRYLKLFDQAERYLTSVGVAPSADRDVSIAKKLNVEFIRKKRRTNAKILMKAFFGQLIFPVLKESDCPLFVPILVQNGKRDDLQRYLASYGVYCPIHWPLSEYHYVDERSVTIYRNELSLVCDQRYSEEDMFRIIDLIKTYLEE